MAEIVFSKPAGQAK